MMELGGIRGTKDKKRCPARVGLSSNGAALRTEARQL